MRCVCVLADMSCGLLWSSRIHTHTPPFDARASPLRSSLCRVRSYLLACTGSGDLQIWDLEQASLVSVGSAHSEEIMQAFWAPDGKQVVALPPEYREGGSAAAVAAAM